MFPLRAQTKKHNGGAIIFKEGATNALRAGDCEQRNLYRDQTWANNSIGDQYSISSYH